MVRSVSIPSADSNWLWVRSRGQCAHPRCSAQLVVIDGGRIVTQGQRAHIRSDVEGGPRFDPSYPNPNAYANLILLCRDHHNLIDTNVDQYPVELLEEWKSNHEGAGTSLHPPTAPPPPVGLRYIRRDDLYEAVRASFDAGRPVALVGISGSGKTQLAADYYRNESTTHSIRIWVRSRDSELRYKDFAKAGAYVGLEQQDGESLPDYCGRVREGLLASPGWLLVFDDAPDIDALHTLIPASGGQVLITSQASGWDIATVPVGSMLREQSIAVLSHGRELDELSKAPLHRLATLAGDLPLCLSQILGYIVATGLDPEDVATAFEDRGAELLSRGAPPDHLSMRVSIGNVVALLSEGAMALLGALSALAPEPVAVPERLAPIEGEDVLGPLGDRLALEDAIAELRRYSLVERDLDGLSCHHITQLIVRDLLPLEERRVAFARALTLVAVLLPERVDRQDHIEVAMALMPHAATVVQKVSQFPELAPFAAILVNRLAPAYGLTGDTEREEEELRRAFELVGEGSGETSGIRASILHNMSNVMADRGDFVGAVDHARQALVLKEAAEDRPESIALTAGTLACHLESMGELEEALALHATALEMLEGGNELRWLVDCINDLARVHRRIGDLASAGRLSRRAAEVASTDPEAWSELTDANLNLALLAEEDGDVGVALRFATAAVEAAETPGMPSAALAKALATRGRIRNATGDYAGVADLRTALSLYEMFGQQSADFGRAQGNLGIGLLMLGQASDNRQVQAEGVSALRESRDLLSRILPPDHPTIQDAERMLLQGVDLLWNGVQPGQGQGSP